MYNIIHSETELKYFFDNILPPLVNDEVYFLSLSARNKYLTEKERLELNLGRTEMFAHSIIRESTFERFLRTIRKYETNEGSYLTKNGSNIPSKCITCYLNINPSSTLKAYKAFNTIMNEYMFEIANNAIENRDLVDITNRIKKMDVLMMNCYQKNRSTKHYLDVDFDIDKKDFHVVQFFCEKISERGAEYFVIDTKSGYHVLLKRDTVKFNYNENIKEAEEMAFRIYGGGRNYEVVHNKNEMIPLPGTFQGGHPVTVIKEF